MTKKSYRTVKDFSLVNIIENADELFHRFRWRDGVVCPYCGEKHIWTYSTGMYKCSKCKKRFTDTSNTVFHKTHLSKKSIMLTMYYVSTMRGISGLQLAQLLQIAPKTAFILLHKVRMLLNQDNIHLTDEIAVDEVYLMGKWSSLSRKKQREKLIEYGLYFEGDKKRTYSKVNIQRAISRMKQPVFGMNDGERIILMCVPNRFNETDLIDIYKNHTENTSVTVSDSSSLYKNFEARTGTPIVYVNHKKGLYATDGYSSNRIEGTFSHVKRRIRHCYVRPTKKYMQLYLNEIVNRWNNRNASIEERLKDIFAYIPNSKPMTYKDIKEYQSVQEREPKHIERIEDFEWNEMIYSIEIDGVTYINPRYADRVKPKGKK